MFTVNIREYLKDLSDMRMKANWALQCYPERYIQTQYYHDRATALSRSSIEGRAAYRLFEEIVGFIDSPTKGGACIDVFKIKTSENTYTDGYDYLEDWEVIMINKAASGIFTFTVDHFLKYGLSNTKSECRLTAYLRYEMSDILGVVFY